MPFSLASTAILTTYRVLVHKCLYLRSPSFNVPSKQCSLSNVSESVTRMIQLSNGCGVPHVLTSLRLTAKQAFTALPALVCSAPFNELLHTLPDLSFQVVFRYGSAVTTISKVFLPRLSLPRLLIYSNNVPPSSRKYIKSSMSSSNTSYCIQLHSAFLLAIYLLADSSLKNVSSEYCQHSA